MKSNALPIHLYRDPSEVVEVNQLFELGCNACDQSHRILTKTYCTDSRNENQKGVPKIGHRCKYFKLKG